MDLSFIINKMGEITTANCGVREMIVPHYSPFAYTANYNLILKITIKVSDVAGTVVDIEISFFCVYDLVGEPTHSKLINL